MSLTAIVLAALSVGAGWSAPADGPVIAGFRYDRGRPFAAGQRRGVDLRAPAGSPVRAACSGRVSHAGAIPRWAAGVSVRCGPLTATHLGLRGLLVHRGARVRRGQRLGVAGPAGLVRLGARVTARRWGWVDPLRLLGEAPPGGAPLGPAPPSARPVRPPPRGAPALRPPAPAPAPARVPAVAWAGALLLAAGLPVGGVLGARRARRRRTEALATAR